MTCMTRSRIVGFVIAAALTPAIIPSTSHAGATGTSFFGPFNASVGGQTISIPTGKMFHQISGTRTFVADSLASYTAAWGICDTSMRFTYGNGAVVYNSAVRRGCLVTGLWTVAPRRYMPRGDACAELWSKDWRIRITRQCHYVY